MKEATGKYVGVRAITEAEAITLAQELFGKDSEGDELWARGKELRAKYDELWARGDALWARGNELWARSKELWARSKELRAKIAIKYRAYIPDYRAINLIAADRDDGVYCFVFNRKWLCFYDGENCPNMENVEKIELKGMRQWEPLL
jgi:hypothetical protein